MQPRPIVRVDALTRVLGDAGRERYYLRVKRIVLPALLATVGFACSNDDAATDDGATTQETMTMGDGDAGDGDAGDGDTGDGDAGDGDAGITPGCDGEGFTDPGDYTREIEFAGQTRQFRIHIPPGYAPDTPTPVILNFHGFGSQSSEQIFFSAMNETSDEKGFIVVYPDGLPNSNGSQAWNGGTCCADDNRDDVGFTRAMVDQLDTLICMDRERLFSTGMSNGGYMSYRLACDAPDLVKAVAPVAGALGIPEASCTPAQTVPLIHIHGTVDSAVPYSAAVSSVEAWASKAGCVGDPVEVYQQGIATCVQWQDCAEGPVELCSAEGIDHCWPGQLFCPYGSSTEDLMSNERMWDFFVAATSG